MTEQAHKQYDRSDNDFSDVPAGRWYTVAVSTLANVGTITGCGDGTFQPGNSISRAEFVTILTGIYGEDTTKGMPFSDVGHTYTELAGIERWTALACPPKNSKLPAHPCREFFRPFTADRA